MTITMNQIKQLRDKTGAGIADVKKALEEAAGSMEQAADILRKKGIAKAARRGDRETGEGVILAATNENKTEGYLFELNSETDFVARNEQFQNFAQQVFALVQKEKPAGVEQLLALLLNGASVQEKLEQLSGTIGEKLVISNLAVMAGGSGRIASYIHGGGKIGALVRLTGGNDELARDIAMQVAASNPKYIDVSEAQAQGADDIAKEKEVYREQLQQESKPAAMWDKIIEGKLQKYFQQVCLIEQEFIKDDKQKVKDILGEAKVEKFVRFALG